MSRLTSSSTAVRLLTIGLLISAASQVALVSRLLRAETALDTLERTRREDHATMQRLESDVRQLGDVGQR